jgi:hypothetical protein
MRSLISALAVVVALSTPAFAGGVEYSPTLIKGGSAPGRVSTFIRNKIQAFKDRSAARKQLKQYVKENDLTTLHAGARTEARVRTFTALKWVSGLLAVLLPNPFSKGLEVAAFSLSTAAKMNAEMAANTRTIEQAVKFGRAPTPELVQELERTKLVRPGTFEKLTAPSVESAAP